jgi:hypothetical protein
MGCSTILGIGPLDAGPEDDGGDGSAAPASDARMDAAVDSTVDGAADAPATDGSSTEGSGGEGAATDGSVDRGATDAVPTETGADVTQPPGDTGLPGVPDAALPSGTIATLGPHVQATTGNAQQTHVAFTAHDPHAWYFYLSDDGTKLLTSVSVDRVQWSAGPTIALGTGVAITRGSDFSLAYGDLGGADVIHFILSQLSNSYSVFHLRTTIEGGAFVHTTSVTVLQNGDYCEPDGPVTMITPSGQVLDATGMDSFGTHMTSCDMDIYAASVTDMGGAAWNATFQETGYYVVSPGETSAHALLPLASGYLGAFADGTASLYGEVAWVMTDAGAWPDADSRPIMGKTSGFSTAEGYDDWALCELSPTQIHAVRHLGNNGVTATSFEQATFDGTSWTTGVAAPTALVSPFNSGVVLLSGTDAGRGMLAAAIGSDGKTVNVAKWSSGWSPWTSVVTGGALKDSLAGSGCGTPHPMLFWTEYTLTPGGTEIPQTIQGLDVSSLF